MRSKDLQVSVTYLAVVKEEELGFFSVTWDTIPTGKDIEACLKSSQQSMVGTASKNSVSFG